MTSASRCMKQGTQSWCSGATQRDGVPLFSLWLHLFILSGIIFPLFFLQVQCWDESLCSAPSSHLKPLPRPTPIHKKVFKMKGCYSWDGPHSSPYWCTLCPNVWTCVYVLSAQLCLTPCDLMDCCPPGSSLHRIFQANFLLQGIFPTQELNPHLLHWQTGSLPPSHIGIYTAT